MLRCGSMNMQRCNSPHQMGGGQVDGRESIVGTLDNQGWVMRCIMVCIVLAFSGLLSPVNEVAHQCRCVAMGV
jgi:hypothetical protein